MRPCKILLKIYTPKSMTLTMRLFLQNKCDDSHEFVLKCTKGQRNLDKLLGSQCMSFNKEGLRFNSDNKKRS